MGQETSYSIKRTRSLPHTLYSVKITKSKFFLSPKLRCKRAGGNEAATNFFAHTHIIINATKVVYMNLRPVSISSFFAADLKQINTVVGVKPRDCLLKYNLILKESSVNHLIVYYLYLINVQ